MQTRTRSTARYAAGAAGNMTGMMGQGDMTAQLSQQQQQQMASWSQQANLMSSMAGWGQMSQMGGYVPELARTFSHTLFWLCMHARMCLAGAAHHPCFTRPGSFPRFSLELLHLVPRLET